MDHLLSPLRGLNQLPSLLFIGSRGKKRLAIEELTFGLINLSFFRYPLLLSHRHPPSEVLVIDENVS